MIRIVPFDGTGSVLLGTDLHITGGGCEIRSCHLGMAQIEGTISTRWNNPVVLTFGLPTQGADIEIVKITVPKGETQFTWQR